MTARRIVSRALAALCAGAAVGVPTLAMPAAAGAEASVEPAPLFSSAPGLPDGRVYEQVSPANKNGNSAGMVKPSEVGYSLATSDGNAVLFFGLGPMGRATQGAIYQFYVARRGVTGWSVGPLLPRESLTTANAVNGAAGAKGLLPAADLTGVAFTSPQKYGPGTSSTEASYLYLAGPEPLAEPTWLDPPMSGSLTPPTETSAGGESPIDGKMQLVGGSADLGTVYFSYTGTLLPEDASRAPYAAPAGATGTKEFAHGFYEWSQTRGLVEAGVLPDGSLDPFGALQASEVTGNLTEGGLHYTVKASDFANVISRDGSRAFFVSPDPIGLANHWNSSCAPSVPGGCMPELYLRERERDGSHRVVLVSKSSLTGLPATDGALAVPQAIANESALSVEYTSYVYVSPDGSQAFFESSDQLTADAPNDGLPKEYEFDVATGAVTYLPGVTDGVGGTAAARASSQDGSRVLFVRNGPYSGAKTATESVDLWSESANGGSIVPITRLPSVEEHGLVTHVQSARTTSDGSAFVFATDSRLAGFNNVSASGEKEAEVYRYDTNTGRLGCVSCPPAQERPTGGAVLSNEESNAGVSVFEPVVANRGLSSDGGRVFFGTPDALVPQDTNGKRDVYEWEKGTVYLITSGTGNEDSFFLDNSSSGDDVFFTTSAGLVAGDTDGAYDVYDARVPRPGDTPPAAAVPCAGSVCQGPPRVPSSLGAPASATFVGASNAVAEAPPTARPKAAKKNRKPRKRKRHKGRKATRSRAKRSAAKGGRRR